MSADVCGARFRSIEGPTVLTKRNFGLTRGRSLQDAANLLQQFVCASTTTTNEIRKECSPILCPNSVNNDSISPKNKFGHGGFGDRSANVWHWPLGQVKIINHERTFEAQLTILPFSCDEITANVMGSELFIHCKAKGGREFYRSYQLPLNIEPRSVRFRFKDARFLLVTAEKELPIKLAVAFAPSDEEESLI